MKRRLLISLLSVLSIAGCTLEEGIEVGLECPPRLFAYDIDAFGKESATPFLCMLDEADITDTGIANCIPCDFAMNKIDDGEYIYLDKNNFGNFVYKNKNEDEEIEARKYLSEDTKDYIINKYSDYKTYVSNLNSDNEKIELYAIAGLCTKTDLERYDECKSVCNDELIGCDDEVCTEIIERAEKCFKLKGYNNFFKDNTCPAKYPICSFGNYGNNGNHYYCTPNVECTSQTKDNDCSIRIMNWVSGQCKNNSCVVEECSNGFQPSKDGKACVADCLANQHYDNAAQQCVPDDIFNCGFTGYVCSEHVAQWVDGSCISGVCTLSECETGYKVVDNACKSDCLADQHYDSEQARCIDDDIENCGATGRKCIDEIKNSSTVHCTSGKCYVDECTTGYTVSDNSCSSSCTDTQYYDSTTGTCVPSDINNCGMKGYACNEKVAQWEDGECQNNVCILNSCKAGFKLTNNTCQADINCTAGQHYDSSQDKCVADDINNCGTTGYKCSERVAQWSEGSCVNGICTLSKCENGYKIVENSCKSDCKANEHYDSDQSKCVADDINNCGATGHVCKEEIKNSHTVSCDNGKCFVSECNSGYTVNNNVCASSCTNTQYYDSSTGICADSDENNCGQKDYICSEHISNWSSGSCTNNVCVVNTCQSGYAVINNECKADCGTTKFYDSTTGACVDSDVNNCGQKGYKCSSQVSNWSAGTCSNNACIANECVTGFKPSSDGKYCVSDCTIGQHYDSYQARCVADDIDNCGATGHKCTDEIKNSKTVHCSSGKCYVDTCNSGYTVNNNVCASSCSTAQYYDSSSGTCTASTIDNCGQKGYKCSAHISNWKSGSCSNNVCVLTECYDGYTVVNNECKADCGTTKFYDSTTGSCVSSDISNCGQKGYKCSQNVSNWSNGTCSNNVCIVTSCSTGYKPSSDGKQCVSDCSTGQHYDSSMAKCVADDVNNCGATGHSCKDEIKNSKTVSCSAGKCLVSACNSGYTINNNVCTSSCTSSQYYDSSTGACATSNINNCGQKGYKCSEHISNWNTGSCTNNACVVQTCNSGYAVVNNECKADCGNTQYYDSATGTCVASNINNCGQKNFQCYHEIANWSDGNCTNNTCIVSSCTTGYKPSYNGKFCISDCSSTQYYNSSTGTCYTSDTNNCGQAGYKCSDHILNWKTGTCTNNVCTVSTCNSGYTVKNNACVSSCSNTQYYDSTTGACATSNVSNCGQKGYKCSEHISNWSTGSCTSNACIVSTCASGYAVVNNECKADCGTTKYYDSSTGSCVSSDANNCGQKGYKCSDKVPNWSTGTCTNNVCTVSTCNSGYKVSNNACVANCSDTQYYDSTTGTCKTSDINNCGKKYFACYQEISHWSNGSCTNNTCVVTSCTTGYKPAINGKSCIANCSSTTQYYDSSTGTCQNSNADNCGMQGYACADHHPHSSTGTCTNNVCVISTCASGYTLINNECLPSCSNTQYYDSTTGSCKTSDPANCGQKGYNCSDHHPNSDSGTCTNNQCIITACFSGYNLINNECRPSCSSTQYYDSSTSTCQNSNTSNCGQKGYKCSDLAGWITGTCTNNKCVATYCSSSSGYHLSDGKCVADTNTCCGSSCTNCTTSHKACISGYCQSI